VLARLAHTVPTLDGWRQSARWDNQADDSPVSDPVLDELDHPSVRAFRRYYTAVRLPVAVHVGIIAHRFPPPARTLPAAGGDWASRFSRVEFLYMRGVFDSAGWPCTCDIAHRLIAFRMG
jgi:hypothetical protein